MAGRPEIGTIDAGGRREKLEQKATKDSKVQNHTIRGQKKMKLRIGLAYMGMLAMALARIKHNPRFGS